MSRRVVALACLVGLTLVAAAWSVLEYRVSPPELGHPDLAPGTAVVLPIGRVAEVSADGAVIEKPPEQYVVRGQAAWSAGEEWSLGGTWDGEAIALAWAEPHPGRPGKKWLGALGLAFTAGLGALGLRWSVDGLVARG